MKKMIIIIITVISLLSAATVDYEALHEKGKMLYQAGAEEDALKTYQEILNNFPDDVDALLFRGRLYARMEHYDLAEKDLQRVIALTPEYLDAYYALASVYFWNGHLDKARTVLTDWISKDLKNPDAYLLSARVAIADRNHAAARTFLEQAGVWGADPATVEALFGVLQTPQNSTNWETGLTYEYLAVDQGRPDWQQANVFIKHDFGKIFAIAEFNSYRRNDLNDQTLVLDTYYKLWKKAYMNLRLQAGLSGTFMPVFDMTAEMFQAIGTRQEPAWGYRMMHYDSLAVHIPSVAWALYPGKWYIRDKVSMVVYNGISWQNQITLRYFLHDVDTYLQLMNVLGTDFINNVWMNSISFALSGSLVISEHWKLSGVVSWTRDEYGLNRTGGSLGIAYRW